MQRPRDLPEIAEKKPETLFGYPVVYIENACELFGCTSDLMFIKLSEYHARRISEDDQKEEKEEKEEEGE